jgi:hypothetical protein
MPILKIPVVTSNRNCVIANKLIPQTRVLLRSASQTSMEPEGSLPRSHAHMSPPLVPILKIVVIAQYQSTSILFH